LTVSLNSTVTVPISRSTALIPVKAFGANDVAGESRSGGKAQAGERLGATKHDLVPIRLAAISLWQVGLFPRDRLSGFDHVHWNSGRPILVGDRAGQSAVGATHAANVEDSMLLQRSNFSTP